MNIYRAAAALIGLAVSTQGVHAACLQKEELKLVVMAMAPPFLEGAAERCSSFLPPNAFIRTQGASLAARLTRETNIPPGQMIAAFSKFGDDPPPAQLSDATMAMVLRDVVKTQMVADLKSADCAALNEIAEAIAPLPAANVGQLIGGIMSLSPGTGGKSGLRLCSARTNG